MVESIELTYTDAQMDVFFNIPKGIKYEVITKGRRFGATRGAAHACIEWGLEGKKILWGDTINSNIDRYFERYFQPALNNNGIDHNFQKQIKQLNIHNGYIDFRSADRPENWEGFGYDYIFLNEAGIILNNKYLYSNAVLPMLMDSPDSVLIAAGVPKGKFCKGQGKDREEHPFYTIFKAAKNGTPRYLLREYSSYDNPLLSEEEIKELEKEIARMSPGMVEQEIYGHFVDGVNGVLWTPEIIHVTDTIPEMDRIVIGVDPSGSIKGDEIGIIAAGIRGDRLYILSDKSGHYSPLHWATVVATEYNRLRADCVVVERNFGGDMVKSNINTVSKFIRIKEVTASRGKDVRAEPVVGLYENHRVYHNKGLYDLEQEQLTWIPGMGKSPNRIDAEVWAVTELIDNSIDNDMIVV